MVSPKIPVSIDADWPWKPQDLVGGAFLPWLRLHWRFFRKPPKEWCSTLIIPLWTHRFFAMKRDCGGPQIWQLWFVYLNPTNKCAERSTDINLRAISTFSEQIGHSTVDLHLKEISEFLHGGVMNKDFTLPWPLKRSQCALTLSQVEPEN